MNDQEPITEERKDVFLCHAWVDKPMVRSIALGLERYGISTWIDEAEMKAGDVLFEKISSAINLARKFCVFITENSRDKNWVRYELQQAMQKEIDQSEPFIIPVVLHECEVPTFLRPKLYVDLRNWDRYSMTLEKLAVAVLGDLTDVPSTFSIEDLDDANLSDSDLFALPPEQQALELRLRYDRWHSRRICSLRNYSGLTLKQVISYCERCPHVVLSPKFNAMGEIFYGVRWRVLEDFDSERHYQECVARYITMMSVGGVRHRYPMDVVRHFLSFHTQQE